MFATYSSKSLVDGFGALALAVIVAGGLTVGGSAAARSGAEYFSKNDIERSAQGYRLAVPGVGDVYVTALRAPAAGKECRIHKPSLIKLLKAEPPSGAGPQWRSLTIDYCSDGSLCCRFPAGGGCYIMVLKP